MKFEKFDSKKELSDTSKKIYRSVLNKLANEGYDTKELLLKKQKEVIKVIDEILVPGLKTDSSIVVNDNDRMMRRRYLSAIFWVLDDTTQQERTDYYKYFLSQKGDYINVADRVE